MKKLILFAAVVVAVVATGTTLHAQEAATLEQLLDQVKRYRDQSAAENNARVREFQQSRDRQQALLGQAKADLNAEEGRSATLKNQFDANEVQLGELSETLRVRLGNLGELFGVVRQVAGDAKGVIDSSLVSAQYPDRGGLLTRLANTKGLPSIDELNELRVLLQQEMTESGKVVKFPASIVKANGEQEEAEVVRVGVFNVITGDRFLKMSEKGSLEELARQPQGRFRSLAQGLSSATDGVLPMAVDPTYGALLGLLIQAPDIKERIGQGGLIGYVIIALGIVGLLVALERFFTLGVAGSKIKAQLKSSTPKAGNALGRILGVYHENRDIDTETLELKLDEAILREAPPLEKRQGAIKVIAAVAPLLGLLGTVTGMIQTFQSITLFGTGDPKLMAGGISQALMTTVLGLVVAIPLVLLHSVIAGRSKSLIEILEEQSAGIIASHSEKGE